MEIKYKIYNPAGNITALVIGDEYNVEQKILINNKIMKDNPKVEQVGFLSEKQNKLTMAGGEFCGNATRCAVSYYISEKENMQIEINNKKLNAGKYQNMDIWCEIPIDKYKIIKLDAEIYKIVLEGITIVSINLKNVTNNDLKQFAKKLIKQYEIDDDAIGIMFVEEMQNNIKIYPIVWVKSIDTLFFENACGSGTIAVTMLKSWLMKKSEKYIVEQPSGKFLKTEITVKNNKIEKAILIGDIKTDNIMRMMII